MADGSEDSLTWLVYEDDKVVWRLPKLWFIVLGELKMNCSSTVEMKYKDSSCGGLQ